MNRIDFGIFVKDFFSGAMDKLQASTTKLDNKLKKISAPKLLSKSFKDIDDQIEKLEDKIHISVDLKEIRQANKEIQNLTHERNRLERRAGINKKGGDSGNMGANMMGKLGAAAAGFLAVDQLVSFGKEIIETTAKFEKFEAVLTNTLGSRSKAKQKLTELTYLAAKTPFQIDEITDSFIKLENRGFKPTMADMTSLGDVASSTGKGMDQLVEAVLDAQMGEFERLKEFGIKANKVGNDFVFNFKNKRTVVKATDKAVKDYIISLGKLGGVEGSMAAISQTTGGMISNLADSWDMLKKTIGDSNTGVLKDSISMLTKMVQGTTKWMEIPVTEKLRLQQGEIKNLTSTLETGNLTETQKSSILSELNSKYPELLSNIDLEKTSTEELVRVLKLASSEYDKKINLSAKDEIKKSYQDDKDKAESDKLKAEKKLNYIKEYNKAKTKEEQDVIAALYKKETSTFEDVLGSGNEKNLEKTLKEGIQQSNIESNIASNWLQGAERDLLKAQHDELMQRAVNFNKDMFYGNENFTNVLKDDKKKYDSFTKLLYKRTKTEEDYKALEGIMAGTAGKTDPKATPDPTLNSGVSGITGSTGVKNININLGKLQESLNIYSQNVKESTGEIERLVSQALLRVVNSANGMN